MSLLGIIVNVFVVLIFLVYWGVAFAILYHLTRFGIGVQPKRFAAVFLLGSLSLSAIAIILYMEIDIVSLISNLIK